MNNDNNTTSSVVVGCSSITTTATAGGAGTGAGGAAGVSGVTGSGTTGTAAATAAMNANESGSTLSLVAGHSTTTISTTSPSIYTSASAAKSAAVPTTGRNEDKTKKSEHWEESRLLKDLDICRFKHLLEEAYSYKNPRDKENKSEAFLQLLQKAENEKEDTKYAFSALTSRYTRNTTSNSQKQGGSLQDLVEAVRTESLDFDYTCGSNRNRRHNHNSRPKKYSSVSSRQREGGSLPSNVNVSNCSLSVYEQPFMNEEKTKQRRSKNEVRIVANNTSTTTDLLTVPTTTRGSGTGGGGGGSVGIGRTSPAIIATGNPVHSGSNYTATAAAQLCGGVAEISLTTNPCTALRKGDHHPPGGGCGSACEGAIGAISLAATIGNSTSATCAALATATAVVSDCADTVIEMNENYSEHHTDIHAQGIQFDRIDGIEKKIPRANIIGSVLTRSDFSPNNTTCYVDEAVHFTTLERGKSTVDASYIPLDENYKACKSVLGEKSELVKMQSFSATKTISKQFDENGNSLNTTYTTSQSQAKGKKKKSQSERNTKTLDLQSFEGYRGFESIDVLVKYIESSEDTRQNDKVSKIGDSSSGKKKDRKKDKEKEKDKEKSKMKRSNSLEELRSCSKLDGDDVTMRNKNNAKNNNNNSKANEVKDKQPAPPSANTGANRKGERRSWGTEELTYLGENNTMEEVREKVKDKEKKKSKDKDKDTGGGGGGGIEKTEKVVEKRKKSDANLVVSMESISCESAEFHVVTKKKKPKKQRQAAEDGKNNNSGSQQKNQTHQNRKYHSNFSNDRDAYINSLNSNNSNDKSRRKSTSSMPPSEKSDSSDLDSVHSLPIESAGGRSPLQAHHHHQNQPRSYAEIARKTDAAGGAVVSPGGAAGAGAGGPTTLATIDSNASNTSSNNSSHTELEINVTTTTLPPVNTSSKKSKKSLKTDFPELISNDAGGGGPNSNSTTATIKQISYSQSLTSASKNDEVVVVPDQQITPPKAATVPYTVEINKSIEKHPPQAPQQQMTLQKSKSMETECFYKSIDQYPALEKTVKRHSTTNTGGVTGEVGVPIIPPQTTVLPPVQIHAAAVANMSCIPIANPAPVSKKSKTNTKVIEEVLVAEPPQSQSQPPLHQTTMISMPSTAAVVVPAATTTTTSSKKSKKDKSTESFPPVTPQFTTSSSSATSYTAASNINNKNQMHHNHPNYNLTSNTNIKSSSNSSHISNTSSSNKFSSRPAVIILNDDTNACGLSSGIGNEFTFGDFNEEELRLFDESQPPAPAQQQLAPPPPQQPIMPLPNSEVIQQKRYTATVVSSLHNFDDSGSNFNVTMGSGASDMANNSDDVMLLMQHTSSPNSSLVIDQSSDSGIYSNYEGVKVGRKAIVVPSSVPAVAMVNAAHSTGVSHRSSSTENTNSNNIIQSSVSTSPSKESLSSASTTSSSSSSASSSATPSSTSTYVEKVPASQSTGVAATVAAGALSTTSAAGKAYKSTATATANPNQQPHQQQPHQIQLDSKNKSTQSNLCNMKVSIINKRSSSQQQLQQQQLETCDDIETAIIAAAKKAAAVAAEQTTAITKAYNAKSSSNSPPVGSTATNMPPPPLQLNNSNNDTNNYSHPKGVTSPPPQSSSSSSSSSICQSNNKDYNRRGVSVGGGPCGAAEAAGIGGALLQQHRKEIDVHFIPPTLATPISSIQNNETIINFIGSAWEEVANSKVTQFYDGQ